MSNNENVIGQNLKQIINHRLEKIKKLENRVLNLIHIILKNLIRFLIYLK